VAVLGALLHPPLDLVEDPPEVSLPEQDLLHTQLIYHRWPRVVDVGAEVELLSAQRVPLVGAVEVLAQFGDGDVEVEGVVLMQHPGDEVDEETVGRILVSRELHLHRPELHAPPDLAVNGDLEPD
jgi:hypothetical protein